MKHVTDRPGTTKNKEMSQVAQSLVEFDKKYLIERTYKLSKTFIIVRVLVNRLPVSYSKSVKTVTY